MKVQILYRLIQKNGNVKCFQQCQQILETIPSLNQKSDYSLLVQSELAFFQKKYEESKRVLLQNTSPNLPIMSQHLKLMSNMVFYSP